MGKYAAKIKAGINVSVPIYVSVALIAYAGMAVAAAFSEQDCEETGFDWLSFMRTTASFVFSLPVVASGLAYVLCKQFEQVCEAKVQLSLAQALMGDESVIMQLGDEFMELTGKSQQPMRGESISDILNKEYKSSVKFRKARYAAITATSALQPTAGIASIALGASGHEKIGSIVDLIGAFLFTLGAVHTTYYKVWDASKIRATNDQLGHIKDILFKNNTDCLIALTHAVHGESDVKKLLSPVGSDEWRKTGVPVKLLHAIAAHRQKMLDFCQHLAKVANTPSNFNPDTFKVINEVRIITAQLLQNHAIIAQNIDLGNPMKIASQSPELNALVNPFKRMAHKLRVAVEDKPLSPMSEEDSRELQEAAHTINLRFDSLHGDFERHAKAITTLQTTTAKLTTETQKLKMQMNGMEIDHKKETSELKSGMATMSTKHEEETSELKSEMATMKKQLELLMENAKAQSKTEKSDEKKQSSPSSGRKGPGMFG